MPAFTAAAIHAIALLLPLSFLAFTRANPRTKSLYQAWFLAAVSILLLAPLNLIDIDEAQASAVAQIAFCLIYILFLLFFRRRNQKRLRAEPGKLMTPNLKPARWHWLAAIFAGLVMLIPWVIYGALGSILDSFLQLILAIEIGLAAGILTNDWLLTPLQIYAGKTRSGYILAGLGIGGVLWILSSATAFPFGGLQILLLLSLPGLGWSIAAIWILARSPETDASEQKDSSYHTPFRVPDLTGPISAMIGLAAAGPLLFIDADELALVISSSLDEILFIALRAAGFALLLSIVLALPFLLGIGWRSRFQSNASADRTRALNIAFGSAMLLVGLALVIAQPTFGQPGLYGERMLVILKEQAEVSRAKNIEDYDERRTFVFTTLTQTANRSQADLRQLLNRLQLPYIPYYLVNAIETVDNPLLRLYLQSRPEVDRILDSPHLRPLPELPGASLIQGNESAPTEPDWNLTLIGADRVWQEFGVTGKGILIGQSDSGVQGDHPDLATQYRGRDGDNNYSWLDPWNHSTAPVDLGGHGTHTLGSALGKRTGVAPDAEWLACVNLARNLGNPAFYLDCMQFMLAPHPQDGDPFTQGEPTLGAHVINNSWGCPEFEGCDAWVFLPGRALCALAGIFVVAGAGNDGPACSTVNSPLPIYAEVFAAGAIDNQEALASFSSLGPVLVDGSQRTKPDLAAPGVNVLSTLPASSYGLFSGTSMASPHVTGVVALIWSANPTLIGDIEATEQILFQSARPFSGELPECPGAQNYPSTAVGYGILDAYAAVQMALGK